MKLSDIKITKVCVPYYNFNRVHKKSIEWFYDTYEFPYKKGTEPLDLNPKDYTEAINEYEQTAKGWYIKKFNGLAFIFCGGLKFFVGGEKWGYKNLKEGKNFENKILDNYKALQKLLNREPNIYEFLDTFISGFDLEFWKKILTYDYYKKGITLDSILSFLAGKFILNTDPFIVKIGRRGLHIRNVEVKTIKINNKEVVYDYKVGSINTNKHILLNHDLIVYDWKANIPKEKI